MEEVVEIVGAQISCAVLGDVHAPRRGVRLGFERIESAALRVLQRHVDPVEQLCRLVHRTTGLYSRHHVFWRAAPLGTASVRTAKMSGSATFRQSSPCSGWMDATLEFTLGSPGGPREPDKSDCGERRGSMKRKSRNASVEA